MKPRYNVEVFDGEGDAVYAEEKLSLMGVRVFCETKLYPKLHSEEWQAVLIVREVEESNG